MISQFLLGNNIWIQKYLSLYEKIYLAGSGSCWAAVSPLCSASLPLSPLVSNPTNGPGCLAAGFFLICNFTVILISVCHKFVFLSQLTGQSIPVTVSNLVSSLQTPLPQSSFLSQVRNHDSAFLFSGTWVNQNFGFRCRRPRACPPSPPSPPSSPFPPSPPCP